MAITKTTVTHSLISPSEDPVQRGGTIQLGGFVGREWRDIQGMTTDGQIIAWEPADADENGEWSVQLVPNDDVATPTNTLYRYLPAQGYPVVFLVPQGGLTHALKDLVVTDPAQWPSLTPTTVGPAGPPNSLAIGTVTTGAPGSSASANITGTPPSQTLDLTIPRGDEGEAATVAVDPATVTGDPGTPAAVSNTGDTHAAVLKFTIPRGAGVLNGSGAPSAGVGANGEFYIDTTGHVLYGPKASGAWPAGVSLIGPQGDGLEYDWDGTKLGVRVAGDPSYTYTDLVGPAGPQGVVWQGDWSSSTAYAVGDGVAYNGSSYICILTRSATATTPDADGTHWAVLAMRGTDGTGAVSSVNGLSPDGTGDVTLTPADIGAATDAQGALADTAVQPTGPTLVGQIWGGTQAQYDAIVSPDPNTLYVVTP